MTILEEARLVRHRSPWFRLGQAVYSVAHARNPKVVRELAGSNIDPFHDNKNIDAFLARLRELGVQ